MGVVELGEETDVPMRCQVLDRQLAVWSMYWTLAALGRAWDVGMGRWWVIRGSKGKNLNVPTRWVRHDPGAREGWQISRG